MSVICVLMLQDCLVQHIESMLDQRVRAFSFLGDGDDMAGNGRHQMNLERALAMMAASNEDHPDAVDGPAEMCLNLLKFFFDYLEELRLNIGSEPLYLNFCKRSGGSSQWLIQL